MEGDGGSAFFHIRNPERVERTGLPLSSHGVDRQDFIGPGKEMQRIQNSGPHLGKDGAREGFLPQGPDGVDAHAVVPEQEVPQPDDQNPVSFRFRPHRRIPVSLTGGSGPW